MKFSEMPYERPDLVAAFSAFDAMAQAIASAPDAAAVLAQYAAFEKLAAHLSTMATLAEVRHTIDTRDAFYEAERQFFDENSPRLADKADAWRRYLALVGRAGTETYPGLVAAAGFASPFSPGTMKAVAEKVGEWVGQQDAALREA